MKRNEANNTRHDQQLRGITFVRILYVTDIYVDVSFGVRLAIRDNCFGGWLHHEQVRENFRQHMSDIYTCTYIYRRAVGGSETNNRIAG